MAAPQTATPQFDPNAPMSDVTAPSQQPVFDPNAPMSDLTGPSGQITNEVGQTVIVPQQGESFADTLKRAVAYRKSLTPEQQQASINAETATIPKKVAQTMGAAAGIGTVGPLALAAGGELVPAFLRSAINAGAARLTPYVTAAGEWAEQHPAAREILKYGLKRAVDLAGAGAAYGGYRAFKKWLP